MPVKLLYYTFLLGLLGLFSCQHKTANQTAQEDKLFTLLSPEQTGITFQNNLSEGLNTNILMYEYFYNGGGVATGDFNADGLIDAYFTSNMAENKLYLNKGKMVFEDITQTSGAAGRPGPWKTGVCTVDINNDNKLDIYLCYSGAMPAEKRANQLFVNQGNDAKGNPVFLEQAQVYGLASSGFSNQAYFFDYDKDGDLDMALLNHNPKNLPILNEESTKEFIKQDDPDKGLRIFKQTNNHFDDVTTKVGVGGSALSYGLGLGLGDFNQDGYLDFYLSNDYAVPDYLYINNGNGTFSNQAASQIRHNSQFSMGNDVADINNDGFEDIFTLDMLPEDNHRQKLLLAPDNFAKFELNVRSGFNYQYMRNMLQINNGNGTFSEIGQSLGISNTDWSWAALLADFDNDGWKDLYVSNGYNRDYTNLDFIKYMDDFTKEKGRLQRTDVLQIISQMPASNVVNYVFKNKGQLQGFENQTINWGMDKPSNSNGAVYADLDNDGDLDLLVNNINQPAFVYQNESQQFNKNHYLQINLKGKTGNTQGIGAKVSIFENGKMQHLVQTTARGYLSAVSPILHFGLAQSTQIDSLVIVWASGQKQVLGKTKTNQVLTLDEKDAGIKTIAKVKTNSFFTQIPSPIHHQNLAQSINDFDRQLLLTSQLSHNGPTMTKGDLNKDGLEDIFVAGASGQAGVLFLQQKNGNFSQQKSAVLEADKNSHDAAVAILDANADGFQDIYVAGGGYHLFNENDPNCQDRLYINNGKGNFIKSALPQLPGSKSCLAVNDANNDGHPVVFVGGSVIPGRYPQSSNSYLLVSKNNTLALAASLPLGIVTDALWIDLNNDTKKELLVVGEWATPMVFEFINGKLEEKTAQYFDQKYLGWWNKISEGDFNQDGKPDLMIGNWGTNSQIKASKTEPVEMYFGDFDNNGSTEPILCSYVKGKSYPYVTRDELLNQIGGLRAKYPNYASYADATIEQIFEPNELSKAGHLTANYLETTLFLSSKTGKYTLGHLPVQAQYAPVHSMAAIDFNKDGHQDILLMGNNYHTKIRLGQMDANYGVLLKGNGKGGFEYVDQSLSGFNIRGDVRSNILINNILYMGMTGQKIAAYQLKK